MSVTPLHSIDLEACYSRALDQYLQRGGEAPLHEAYELGRRALSEGRGVLDMVHLHHEALAALLRSENSSAVSGDPSSEWGNPPVGFTRTSTFSAEMAARAGQFFAESMSCFEMAYRAIDEAKATLHNLNDKLEEEVRRIALALHDDAGQLVAVAQMRLDDAMGELPIAAQDKLHRVKVLLDRVDDRLRHLSHELHPAMLEHLGLAAALEFLATSMAERSGLRITVRSSLRTRLSQRLTTALYRIVQEALRNIRRHARASTVHIRISDDGTTVRCTVSDDGVGFDPDAVSRSGLPGLGLRGIQERINALGGALRIDSAPGRGTKLDISAPF